VSVPRLLAGDGQNRWSTACHAGVGVWLEDAFWFSSSDSSRKTKNIDANPAISVTTDDPHAPVVVEGAATRHGNAQLSDFVHALNAKYSTDYDVGFFAGSAVFVVMPTTVFGLDDDDFTGTPTRWRFIRDSG